MKLLLHTTPTALWHEIIHEAENICSITLKEELEAYLVFLLMRHTQYPELTQKIIAPQLLEGLKLNSRKRQQILRQVGDQCLIFSGLFPKIATKKLIKISYFVNLGQTAYITISDSKNDLYSLLAEHFVSLMDILQSVRQYAHEFDDLLPLEAYDLWNETGSKRALKVLQGYSNAHPQTTAVIDETGILRLSKGIN